ncbi:MAG: hypothetical protein GY877_03255 [Hyphomicrobium sp.]|nr:hypothetical protein [Hyphomicrobium sp.]
MKVKTTVELKFDHAYTGWKALTFNDSDQNEVCITMTDDQYLSLTETLNSKADRIRKDRAEEAAEAARAEAAKLEKENEDG